MFKRTNMRKALAILLALCLIPTAALAAEATNTVAVTSAVANADGSVTVKGTSSIVDAEISILALRGAEAYTTAILSSTDEEIDAMTVYVDQEPAVSGAFTFNFVPRAEATAGGFITIFIGGDKVEKLAVYAIDMLNVVPSATALALKDAAAAAAGKTVEAAYAFHNGNMAPSADTTTGDVSEVTWYVEGITEAVGSGKTLALNNDAWVGKKLSFTVLPKTDVRATYTEGVLTDAFDCGYIKPEAGYTPEVSEVAVEGGKVSANKEAKAVITYTKKYANATYVEEFKWLESTDGETFNAITGKEAATATFDPNYIDMFVKVQGVVKIQIGGTTFSSTSKESAVYEITSVPPTIEIGTGVEERKPYATGAFALSEGKGANVNAISNIEGDATAPTLSYAWYITDTFVAAESFDATGLEVKGTTKSFTVPANTETKYVVVVITATDALGITATKTIAFTNAIATLPSGGGNVGGAALGGGGIKPADPTSTPSKPAEEDPAGEAVTNGAAAFTDISKETYAWAYDSIDTLAKSGVFKGMTPTTFGPELTATNAQVVALVVRIAGLKAKDGAATDLVAKDHWVQKEMAAAAENGILAVFGGKVDIEAATTREVAFTLLYNALKVAGVKLPETASATNYSDATSIAPACAEAITALTKAGIINGMGDGTLAPKATITRAQLAKILGPAATLIG